MYKSAYISYNHTDRTLKIKGMFGLTFKKEMLVILNKSKLTIKPLTLTNTCVMFYISTLLEYYSYLTKVKNKKGVNKKIINDVLIYLKNLENFTVNAVRKQLMRNNVLVFKPLKRQNVKQHVINKKIHITTKNISCTGQHDLHVDTLVKIPNGWAHIVDIRQGDVVIGKNGLPITVTAVHTIEPRQLYTMRFADGRTILAGENHLWEIFLSIGSSLQQNRYESQTLTTLEIKDLISIYDNKCYVELIEPEQSLDKNLPIAPYLLGAMIAGGMLTAKYIWFNSVTYEYIETLHDYILQGYDFYAHGEIGYELRPNNDNLINYYIMFLDNLGLKAVKNKDKFIPKLYLEASPGQRWDLLQGILDSCLLEKEQDSIIVSTLSENLANDIAYLVRSLGGIAKVVLKDSTSVNPVNSMHRILIWHSRAYKFFKVPHRINMFSFSEVYNKRLKLQITNITKSIVSNSRCISVDSEDKSYVIENFIVTKYSRS